MLPSFWVWLKTKNSDFLHINHDYLKIKLKINESKFYVE